MGHSVLLLWGSESQGFISRWFIMGGSCIFLGFQGLVAQAPFVFGSSKFRLVSIRPYNAIAFTVPIITYVSVFILYPLGQSSWFFGPSFGVATIFRFLLFLQGFHNWTLNPFHDGSCRFLGKALLSAIHGATLVNTIY